MRREKRSPKLAAKRVLVYCEGSTESNYVNGFKSWLRQCDPSLNVVIKSESVDGGGYASIRRRLEREPDSNCIARVVLLDLDRYINHSEEKDEFKKLLEYSRNSTKKRVPCVLVASSPSFEYPICCHDSLYKHGDEETFLTKEWGYKSMKDFKADSNVWEKSHRVPRSHEVAFQQLERRPVALVNKIRVELGKFSVVLQAVSFSESNVQSKGSNIRDLFAIVGH